MSSLSQSPLLTLCPISLPIPEIVTETLLEFPESYRKFPLAVYFIYSSVYVDLSLWGGQHFVSIFVEGTLNLAQDEFVAFLIK